jgi:hypothetical protein
MDPCSRCSGECWFRRRKTDLSGPEKHAPKKQPPGKAPGHIFSPSWKVFLAFAKDLLLATFALIALEQMPRFHRGTRAEEGASSSDTIASKYDRTM